MKPFVKCDLETCVYSRKGICKAIVVTMRQEVVGEGLDAFANLMDDGMFAACDTFKAKNKSKEDK